MTALPDQLDAQAELLGGCLLAPSAIPILDRELALDPGDFTHQPYAKAWAAMLDLYTNDGTVTLPMLTAKLGDTIRVGNHKYATGKLIDELYASAGSAGALLPTGRLLKRTSLRRAWQKAGRMMLDAATHDDEQLVGDAERILARPTVSEDTFSPEAVGHETSAFFDETGAVAITTGFPQLDNLIAGGFRPGDSTALGAWTSMGKSALVDQLLTIASIHGYRCHAYINEMSIRDRGLRMLAHRSGIPFSKLIIRDLTPDEITRAKEHSARMPFGITECSLWDADRISRHIRANKWDLCTLDLVHNMPYRDVAELDQIIATLAQGARSAGAHLIIICQFNEARAVGEKLPWPVMRDLRGSGMIKNVCANVLLLHRDQEQDPQTKMWRVLNNGWVIVDKARAGQRNRDIPVEFDPQRMSFSEARGMRAVA